MVLSMGLTWGFINVAILKIGGRWFGRIGLNVGFINVAILGLVFYGLANSRESSHEWTPKGICSVISKNLYRRQGLSSKHFLEKSAGRNPEAPPADVWKTVLWVGR
jgi:hypothetical protein